MGLDYSYELFFPREKLWDVVEAVAAWRGRERMQTAQRVSATFDGQEKELPVEFWDGLWSKNRHINWDEADSFRVSFCLSLPFEPDEDILTFWGDDLNAMCDLDARIRVGCIHTRIESEADLLAWERGGFPGLVLFDFCAATSGMSRLFAVSTSIRRTFVEFARRNGAVCGLFDSEGSNDRILWLDGHEYDIGIKETRTPLDELREIARAQSPQL